MKQETKMLTLKLRAIGNSIGLVLPKEALAKHNIGLNDTLFLTEVPGGWRLTPYDPAIEKQITVARKVMDKYRDALKALAE